MKDTLRNIAGVIGLLAVASCATLNSATINADPPTGDDFLILQDLIDSNPGCTLMLAAGTYDMGAETLVIPHGITLAGTIGADGLESMLTGNAKPLIHVSAIGAASKDCIIIRDLALQSAGTAVMHLPYTDEIVEGGGHLTVDNCHIENAKGFGIWSQYVEDVNIVIKHSTIISGKNDAIRIQFAGYRNLLIKDNVLDVRSGGFSAGGVEILNAYVGEWMEWQSAQGGTANIVGNTILLGNDPEIYQCAYYGGNVLGNSHFCANTVYVPANGTGVTLDMTVNGKLAQVDGNTFIGADANDGNYRIVMEIVEGADPKGRGGAKVQAFYNVITGWWAEGFDSYDLTGTGIGSFKNTFGNNDFTESQMAGYDLFGLPASNYTFWPEAGMNSVTDDLGQEIIYVDMGPKNHLQGSSTFTSLW